MQAEALAALTGDERADAIAALGRGELHRTLTVLREEAEPRPPRSRCTKGSDALELLITDEGGEPVTGNGGHGLVGMRERVAAFGGTLHAGERSGDEPSGRGSRPVTASRCGRSSVQT